MRCVDGVWRALDSKALHPQIKPAGMIYQAALRAELSRRLGVEWGPVSEDGQADILGVPDTLTENWSSRRKVIMAEGRKRIAERETEKGRKLTKVERRIETYRSDRMHTPVLSSGSVVGPLYRHKLTIHTAHYGT